MLINLGQTFTDLSEADCSFYCHPRLVQSKATFKELLVCFSSGASKEAALQQTFTPRFDYLWSIAIQFFVAIHLWVFSRAVTHPSFSTCFAVCPLHHFTVHGPSHLNLGLAPSCGVPLSNQKIACFFIHWIFFFHRRSWNWASAHLWESLFCVRLIPYVEGALLEEFPVWSTFVPFVNNCFWSLYSPKSFFFFFISKQQTCQENWFKHTL